MIKREYKQSLEVKVKKFLELIVKGAGAAVLIGLGDYVLLKAGNPFGPILFSFGLLGVCVLGLNLFTGKCGFLFEDKIKLLNLILILLSNLLFGVLFGVILKIADAGVGEAAVQKIETWEISLSFFVRAVLCGMIMYLAVKLYRKGTSLGILIGVPLFIFSGMQHSIANAITLGASLSFSLITIEEIFICVGGNFFGAVMAWFLSGQLFETENAKTKIVGSLLRAQNSAEQIEKSKRELKIHGVYRHFKGKHYIVEGVARGTEDGEDYVVYRQLYGDGELYVRPKEMFLSKVDKKKYPKEKQKFRFEEEEIKG